MASAIYANMIRIHHYVLHRNFLWHSILWHFIAVSAITFSMKVDPKLWANTDQRLSAEKLFEAHPPTTITSSPAQIEPEGTATQSAPHNLKRPSPFLCITPMSTSLQHESRETQASAKKQKYSHGKIFTASPDLIPQPSASHAGVGLDHSVDLMDPSESIVHSELNQCQPMYHSIFDQLSNDANRSYFKPEVKTKEGEFDYQLEHQYNLAHPVCISARGNLYEPLLEEFYLSFFEDKKNLKDYKYAHKLVKSVDSSLPPSSQMHTQTSHSNKEGYKKKLNTWPLILNFKFLIAWCYDLHEKVLSHYNVKISSYKAHQMMFLKWMEREILAPFLTMGAISINSAPENLTVQQDSHQKFSLILIQTALFSYFSNETHSIILARSIGIYLVKQYQDSNKIDYSALREPAKTIEEYPLQIETNSNFKGTYSYISNLCLDPDRLIKHRWFCVGHEGGYKLVQESFSDFQNDFHRIYKTCGKGSRKPTFRTIHPRLPICVCLYSEKNGDGILRIFSLTDRSYFREDETFTKMKKLLKILQHLHIQFLTDRPEESEMRKNLFKWLHQMIFDPPHSTPIIGNVKMEGFMAPWDQDKQQNIDCFGIVQVQLIKYFGDSTLSAEILRDTAAFIIATWYHTN
ncbi:hypothetical protein PGT21_026445 [Puccinia graminis f. sp. tritici]|uniref:Uncharacterized protein n=1 Tax=Puccinia graminis f. sp. tritici TaxID=56615 RepID=A0A5B0P5D3_PUCGR|nr:hypothetical protein PGT21_026445 [Puccinia graminis f. sp. tritici]KAA1131690.1 hypothetical protein PGTUg99_009235 [Puccinia graminis f. sp. tritici]